MLRAGCEQYIRTISNGTTVSVVQFSTTASVSADATLITSDADRDMLIAGLPSFLVGRTSIGSGLNSAIEVMLSSMQL